MKIILFSAHPDDAETGAGGFCIRAVKAGHDVIIVHMSSGRKGRKIEGVPESKVRKKEGKNAARILGVRVEFLDYPMSEIPAISESSRKINNILKNYRPDIVLTHWPDRKALKKISTPHFFIKPLQKVENFLTAYSSEGGTHHSVIVYGDIRNKLKLFCGIKNIPYVEIR